MHNLIGLLLIATCLGWVVWALRNPGPVALFMAVGAIFTIGYYGLPILLIERSTLRFLPAYELATTIGMSALYFVMLSIGVIIVMRRKWGQKSEFAFGPLDRILEDHWWPVTIIANLACLYYLATASQTIYQFESYDAFVASRSVWSSIIAFFSTLLQAFTALNFVKAMQNGQKVRIAVAGAGVVAQLALSAMGAHRTLFIAPFLFVIASMVMLRQNRMAGITLLVAIAALLAYSPFAVMLRSGSWNGTQDVVAENFSYSEDPIDEMLQSIVDRGDILQSNSILKAHTDANGVVGWQYYYSVLVLPVPRFLYPNKPFVLSDTGDMNGEASILAWHLAVSSAPGSLTAFGAIVAYREGGWIWLTINGLLNGMLMAYLLTLMSRGQYLSQAFYILGFFNWAVRKVPPSLMETMAVVMTYLPVIIVLALVGQLLAGQGRGLRRKSENKISQAPAATAS